LGIRGGYQETCCPERKKGKTKDVKRAGTLEKKNGNPRTGAKPRIGGEVLAGQLTTQKDKKKKGHMKKTG